MSDSAPPLEKPSQSSTAPSKVGSTTSSKFSRRRMMGYVLASTLLALTQGLAMNLVSVNLPQISGALGATTNEAMWLVAAYMLPYASLSLFLVKVRTQFGLRNFAEVAILAFFVVSIMHLFVDDWHSAIIVRFFNGIVAAPMSALAFLYMIEAMPPDKKLNLGLSLALTNLALGPALARLVSPSLLDIAGWHGLHVFEIGISMLAFAAVYLLPLQPQPRMKVIHPVDVVSYLFIAIGLGFAAMVMTLGRFYWWFEAPWLGWMLAISVLSMACAAVIELNRQTPLLDFRWITSREVLHFAAALLIFRIVLSEQTSGAFGFFQSIGLQNEQMAVLCWVVIAATIAGGITSALTLKPGREHYIHIVALSLLTIGALMDSHSTVLTRPPEMFVSQALMAYAGALFLPPAMAAGLLSALKKGPTYILSFIIVFLTTQSIGGALGSAIVGTYVTYRSKVHIQSLSDHLVQTDPLIMQRVGQYASSVQNRVLDPLAAKAQGLSILSQQVQREANVLAYNDAFRAIALLAALALTALVIHTIVIALREYRTKTALSPSS